MDPWSTIQMYFGPDPMQVAVKHQIESYDDFITRQLPKTVEMFAPVVRSDQHYDPKTKTYSLEATVRLFNLKLHRPQIHENNGRVSLMFPREARERQFTYSAASYVDVEFEFRVRDPELSTHKVTIPQVPLGKIPVMVGSKLCVLKMYSHLPPEATGECMKDPKAYFIINGSEKVVLGQERPASNKIFCFPPAAGKPLTAEMKSTPDYKRISPKQVNMYLNRTGVPTIQVSIPRIHKNIPLCVLFRALGILSDGDICRRVGMGDERLVQLMTGSIIEAEECRTQDAAIAFISAYAMCMTPKTDKGPVVKKVDVTVEILSQDLFPHCRTRPQQLAMLGYMARRLLRCHLQLDKCDDRDSYLNKRIDTAGSLLNNLYRLYLNKTLKDLQRWLLREMNAGPWKSTNDYGSIVNPSNISKLIKSSTIENGLKRALSTGDFGMKPSMSSKVGVAQVLNRLSHPAALSHLRRVNKPYEKTGKQTPQRKLHASTYMFICPAETPEGESVGVVKNLSLMTQITLHSDSDPLYDLILPRVVPVEELTAYTKVFINGAWVGTTPDAHRLFVDLKRDKSLGVINIYTSVVFDYAANELYVCNDSGRVVRPVFRMVDNKIPPSAYASWTDLTMGPGAIIEYIDPAEQNASLIAQWPTALTPGYKYTHCELHPSTMFGVLASCIPFPEHNQSPRNTYQCAMGKQAIGIYATSYRERYDKTSYVLTYPLRPLIDTRACNMLGMNDIPSGMTITVAIMSYTGYNQEDSVLISRGAINRGLFQASVYHTVRDVDRKMYGDDEIRCSPDPARTKGMKFGNYSKLTPEGVFPENELIEHMDIISGKVVPLRDARNDPTKTIKFEDLSQCYRTNGEQVYMDRNTTGTNGDGYFFWNGRVRSLREPEIGDKFSSRHGQKGTVGNIIEESDLPFTTSGIKPDIIINPHAIPSRMTIAQLKETLLGKLLVHLGMYGDGTAFTDLHISEIGEDLVKHGFASHGNEVMYNGMTGEQMQSSIFQGPVFYQRLKHMVIDKIHSRDTGPMVFLTRQPAEGRARDGGLRFGEMERDCMIAHGASKFTEERMYEVSDKYVVHTCRKCGLIAAFNDKQGIHLCKACDNRTDFARVKLPYSCKLLFQELMSMNVIPRIVS